MDANGLFNRRQCDVLHTLYRGESKIRVENELSLPDYCADVNRIIRTDVKMKLNEKKITPHSSGLNFSVDGVAIFNVIYASDQHGIEGSTESFTFYSDFSHTYKVNLDQAEGFNLSNIASFVEFAGENANAKLLGPRKLILRTDVVISAILKGNRTFVYYEHTDGSGDIQTKAEKLSKVSLVSSDEREFSVSERIVIPQDTPAIGKILDCDAKLFCEKCICSDGNVRFWGSIGISCLYQDQDSGKCNGIVVPLEFEQAFELAEATDNCLADMYLSPTLLKADYEINESGENRLLLIELSYKACSYLYANESLRASVDCFSLQNELSITSEKAEIEAMRGLAFVTSRQDLEITLSDEGIRDIQAAKGRIDFKDCRLVGDTVEVSGKLRLSLIGQKEDGALLPIDEAVDVEMKFTEAQLACELRGCTRVELRGGLKSLECQIKDGALLTDAELQCQICLFARDDRAFIRDVEIVAEKTETVKSPVTFFYPDEHETLWDVAKLFNIPEKKLLEKNTVTGDQLPSTVIIFK